MHNSRAVASPLLSSPPPRLSRLASRTHVREDTPLARMSPSRSCAKVTRASSRARATTTSSRASAGTSRVYHENKNNTYYTIHVHYEPIVRVSQHGGLHTTHRVRDDTSRHIARGRSARVVTRWRVPPSTSTPVRDGDDWERPSCARCGPRRGRRASRRLARRRRPSSGTCRSERSVARDRDRERRERGRGDARAR